MHAPLTVYIGQSSPSSRCAHHLCDSQGPAAAAAVRTHAGGLCFQPGSVMHLPSGSRHLLHWQQQGHWAASEQSGRTGRVGASSTTMVVALCTRSREISVCEMMPCASSPCSTPQGQRRVARQGGVLCAPSKNLLGFHLITLWLLQHKPRPPAPPVQQLLHNLDIQGRVEMCSASSAQPHTRCRPALYQV